MSRGIILFAHNSIELDYLQMAVIAGGLAKKHLGLPVSLISDESTIAWAKESSQYEKCEQVFDQIITIPQPITANVRRLCDGTGSKVVPFINSSRSSVWELTPYDQTLLIDTDYLIFTDNLNNYWDMESDVKISSAINDIYHINRLGICDKLVSDTGVHLYWATTVMFNKTAESKLFFELVDHIKNNYELYGEIYRFATIQFRNDIAFSIAKHIMDGFCHDISMSLPPIFSSIDKDELFSVIGSKLIILIDDMATSTSFAVAVKDIDIHVMNKQSIIRNASNLMELI